MVERIVCRYIEWAKDRFKLRIRERKKRVVLIQARELAKGQGRGTSGVRVCPWCRSRNGVGLTWHWFNSNVFPKKAKNERK